MLFLFVSVLWASELTKVEYSIGGQNIVFYENKHLRTVTSKTCEVLAKDALCPEFDFLATLDVKLENKKMKQMPSFGSIACQETLNGKVFMGYDKQGNEITFCKIKDYFIDIATLSYYVEKNRRLISPSNRRKK